MARSDTESETPLIQTGIETNEDYTTNETILETRDLNVYYGADQALQDIDVEIPRKQVTAIIGPSGCGKSTFLGPGDFTLGKESSDVSRTMTT